MFSNIKSSATPEILSYNHLRRAVGILGIALPIILSIGYISVIHCLIPPPSISHYYYTNMGTYFTGTLCAVGLFMYFYNGYDIRDKIATNFAAVCALVVAFCPTNISPHKGDVVKWCNFFSLSFNDIRNALHYISASLLFLDFAIISFFLFTLSAKGSPKPIGNKKIRNRIYKVCGLIIFISIALIALANFTAFGSIPFVKNCASWTFIFETTSLFAFGFSWLIKGETFFK